jgi:NAD(P)H-hydrate epimerase
MKIIQKELLYPEIIWERPVHYFKNEGGKVLIIAGSKGNPQKAIMACESVFRSGTGILTLAFPQGLKEIYKDFLPDTMKLPLPETFGGSLSGKSKEEIFENAKACNVTLVGPGISSNAETVHLVWDLVFSLDMPIIICDEATSAVIKGIGVIRSKEDEEYLSNYFRKKSDIFWILTKDNLKKLVNACNFTKEINLKDEDGLLSFLAEKLGVNFILEKDSGVYVSNSTTLVNKVGTELTSVIFGLVSSFVAQNLDKKMEAVATALYLHGLAENISKQKIGDREVLPSDILRYLPEAIKLSENH